MLALLAVPLSYTSPREGRFGKIAIAILIYIPYANLLVLMRKWIAAGTVPSWVGLWPVHIAVVVLLDVVVDLLVVLVVVAVGLVAVVLVGVVVVGLVAVVDLVVVVPVVAVVVVVVLVVVLVVVFVVVVVGYYDNCCFCC